MQLYLNCNILNSLTITLYIIEFKYKKWDKNFNPTSNIAHIVITATAALLVMRQAPYCSVSSLNVPPLAAPPSLCYGLNFAWVAYYCWASTAAQPSPPISPLLTASGLHEPKWFDSTSLDHSTFALTSALCAAQWLHTIQIFSALHRLAYLRPPCTSQSPAAVGEALARAALR